MSYFPVLLTFDISFLQIPPVSFHRNTGADTLELSYQESQC